MSLAIICPHRDMRDWVAALHSHDPDLDIQVWPHIRAPEQVVFALCWNQPADALGQLPNLRAISSLGAGADHLVGRADLPADVPLVRIVDDRLRQSMAEYVMFGVLAHLRHMWHYHREQEKRAWQIMPPRREEETRIGIMGCGELGGYVAGKLAAFGFRVHCWARSRKTTAVVPVYTGREELKDFLHRANILVCLLPLTAATENILNARLFRCLPPGAFLINAARGAHLVEADLLAALDSGQLAGALLDVFRQEPLASDHPFWTHSKIMVTPHAASVTDPWSAAGQVVDNYRRALAGKALLNRVDPARGY